jgi:cellulose synthase/poly-beta-1,6-N-acetylglucosamine synthase-like glycosyltransferase
MSPDLNDELMRALQEKAFARYPQPSPEERQEALVTSIDGLGRIAPEFMANQTFARWQVNFVLILIPVLGAFFYLRPELTGSVIATFIVAVYLGTILQRSWVSVKGLQVIEARAAAPTLVEMRDDMPMYTVLMPAYDEPEVIGKLVLAAEKLDYPAEKLEILLLIEEDDANTIEALLAAELPPQARVLMVPAAEPRTKPKACNYGMQFARGEYITIYDAEDQPEPFQLRKAVALFESEGPDVACLQARLDYFNPTQNLITRWFTIEYTTWFAVVLGGLSALRLPIPLGGTSNHMRASVLRRVGGWDAFNVTEDAELGIRLARAGMRTIVLDSVTYEEANSDLVNWVRQRSRWYKGYMQSWLVHFRKPRQAIRDLGPRGAIGVTLMIGSTPVLAALNIFTWACTVIFVVGVPHAVLSIFPPMTVYMGTVCALIGNATVVYVSTASMAVVEDGKYVWSCLLYPLYWILMAVAAVKAAWQLIFRPSYWEKTAHGLNTPEPEAVAGV